MTGDARSPARPGRADRRSGPRRRRPRTVGTLRARLGLAAGSGADLDDPVLEWGTTYLPNDTCFRVQMRLRREFDDDDRWRFEIGLEGARPPEEAIWRRPGRVCDRSARQSGTNGSRSGSRRGRGSSRRRRSAADTIAATAGSGPGSAGAARAGGRAVVSATSARTRRRLRQLARNGLDDTWDATRAGVAAAAASDIEVWMPVEAGGGTQVMLAVHDVPALPPPHPEPTRLGPALTQAIGIGIVTDWPRALRAYAHYRGGEVEDRGSAGEDGRELILTPAGGDSGATLELDGLERVRKLSMTRAAATLAPSPETPETPRRKSVLGHLFSR